jgi:hypothetical protein
VLEGLCFPDAPKRPVNQRHARAINSNPVLMINIAAIASLHPAFNLRSNHGGLHAVSEGTRQILLQ